MMNLGELKADYARTLDDLLYYLQCNKENTTYSDEEIKGYECCIQDIKEYFAVRVGIKL